MKTALTALLLSQALGQAASHPNPPIADCPGTSAADADAAEVAVVQHRPTDWSTIFKLWSRFGDCILDDDVIGEGMSEAVAVTLAKHWDSVDQLFGRWDTTPAFGKFVLAHIDATDSNDDLKSIVELASGSCPSRRGALCAQLQGAAQRALAENGQDAGSIKQPTPHVLASTTTTAQTPDAGSACDQTNYKEAAVAANHAKRWNTVFQAWKRFGSCVFAEGDAGESMSDDIVVLLAKSWPSLPRLFKHWDDYPAFGRFVLRNIDATTDPDDLKRIVELAKTSCPAGRRNQCDQLGRAAQAAFDDASPYLAGPDAGLGPRGQ